MKMSLTPSIELISFGIFNKKLSLLKLGSINFFEAYEIKIGTSILKIEQNNSFFIQNLKFH